ncbi:MAG: M20/M25/M40 family metallo-hydrolase [Candidatus Kapaibacterium sp.]
MKKIFLISVLLIWGLVHSADSQVVYNHKIDSIKNLVSIQQLIKFNKEITGDTVTNIGGIPRRIVTRYSMTGGNKLAAQYIREKFEAYGLAARYQMIDTMIMDVIGWKTGTKYPNQYFLIGAHFDNFLYGSTVDTIYGADDNGTGICVMLELARLLQGFNTDYSIAFVAFNDEETSGMGSYVYADSAKLRGDSLLGVLNCEMCGWDGNNDNKVTVVSNDNSINLYNVFLSAVSVYQLNLLPFRATSAGSDHNAFWYRGFMAITSSEFIIELTPHYHSITDRWFNLTQAMFEKMAKANIVTFLSLATGYYSEIQHTPLSSSFEQTGRTASTEILMPFPTASSINSPRLYYKINNGQYNWINAYEVSGRKYKFMIPGQTTGTKVSYYIAAQDSSGGLTVTSPIGGSGVNPPGSTPPDTVHVYYVLKSNTFVSTTVPKVIPANSSVRDSIYIGQEGKIKDIRVTLNINHPNNSEVMVVLRKGSEVLLSLIGINLCSGSNFINTNFSDTALLAISQGTAPYTGYFKGRDTLSRFKNINMQGNWILTVYDSDPAVTGTLIGWGLTIAYENTVPVILESETVPDKYELIQNYPNPYNPYTKIRFVLPKQGLVTLKIFDILGREVCTLVNEVKQAGTYTVEFNGSGLTSGVYFYRIESGKFSDVKRMVLIK